MSDFLVKVVYVYPPIPARDMDWAAYVDGEEEDGACSGRTPAIALRELADKLEDRE